MNSGNLSLSNLERYLNLVAARQQAVSSNMANVDTPGYRTRDVNFKQEMMKAEDNSTSVLHAASFASGATKGSEVKGLMERPDGNNVNMDREGLLMSEVQLQYQVGVQLVKHQFHSLLSAINGGS